MKARIKWLDNMSFVGETESGHAVVIDSASEAGGRNLGPRPMELVLLGLGSCSSIDVMLMLQKSRQRVTDCAVEIEAERAEDVPRVFTKIHLHFVVTGRDLSEKHVERAVTLSAEKYCSVSKMLEKTATISFDYELVGADD